MTLQHFTETSCVTISNIIWRTMYYQFVFVDMNKNQWFRLSSYVFQQTCLAIFLIKIAKPPAYEMLSEIEPQYYIHQGWFSTSIDLTWIQEEKYIISCVLSENKRTVNKNWITFHGLNSVIIPSASNTVSVSNKPLNIQFEITHSASIFSHWWCILNNKKLQTKKQMFSWHKPCNCAR